MKHPGYIWIVLISLLAACDTGSQRSFNNPALQEEMRNREPKKLNQAQITAEAYRQGRKISEAAQQALMSHLQKTIQQAGIQEAIKFCNIKALPLTDSLSKAYNADIRRTSLRLRNQGNAPDEIEQQLLEAYQYNAENGLALEDNVQRIDNQYLLYTKPIVINSELCLNCHGKEQEQVAAETANVLDSLYANDKARGYHLGDLRGMWSIRLQQKEIVNSL